MNKHITKKITATSFVVFGMLLFILSTPVFIQAAGSCGSYDVSTIQIIVGESTDGICGPKTIDAIKQWQTNHGLTPDGIVGPQTAQAMGLQSGKGGGGTGQSSCTIDGTDYYVTYKQCVDEGNSINDCSAACGAPASAGGSTTTSGKCEAGYTALAGTCVPNSPVKGGFFDTSSIGDLITRILKVLLGLAGMIAVGLIVVGGFQYITSAGNAEQAEKGRATLVNAIIGLVIVMVAWLLVSLVTNTLLKGTLF
jgi:hypothetical protein